MVTATKATKRALQWMLICACVAVPASLVITQFPLALWLMGVFASCHWIIVPVSNWLHRKSFPSFYDEKNPGEDTRIGSWSEAKKLTAMAMKVRDGDLAEVIALRAHSDRGMGSFSYKEDGPMVRYLVICDKDTPDAERFFNEVVEPWFDAQSLTIERTK